MVSCAECRQCNHKGKPSVMRGSAYCSSKRIDNRIFRLSFFERIKNRIRDMFIIDDPSHPKKKFGGFRV